MWSDAAAAADFLWHGSGFDGIVRDFGRPQVLTWVPEIRVLGPAPATAVTHALVRMAPIPAEADLTRIGAEIAARIGAQDRDDQVHLAVGGIDPTTWQTVEFVTVADPNLTGPNLADPNLADVKDAAAFSVLHISQPAAWS